VASFDVRRASRHRPLPVRADPRLWRKWPTSRSARAMVSPAEGRACPTRAGGASGWPESDGSGATSLLRQSRRDTRSRARAPKPWVGSALCAAFKQKRVLLLTTGRGRGDGVLPADLPRARRPRRGRRPPIDGGDGHRLPWRIEAGRSVRSPRAEGLSGSPWSWPVRPPPPIRLERAAAAMERGAYPRRVPLVREVPLSRRATQTARTRSADTTYGKSSSVSSPAACPST